MFAPSPRRTVVDERSQPGRHRGSGCDRTRPQTMGRPGGRRRRPADGGAGCIHRHHRPAVRAARPAHLGRQSPVGDHGLHRRVRRLASPRGPHRGLRGPQADVHRRVDRLCRRVCTGRPGGRSGHAVRSARPAGCVCGAHGARGAVDLDDHLPGRSARTGQSIWRLWRGVGRGRRHRRAGRRDPHGVCLVALVPADQRSHCPAGGRRRGAHHHREPGRRAPRATTSRAPCSPPPAWSAWSTDSPRRTPTDGHRLRPWS